MLRDPLKIMEYKIIKQRFRNYYNESFITAIQKQFGISELSAAYLACKGFSTLGQTEEFLYPKPQDLNNPFLFSEMEKCVARIIRAIINKEKIAIYGDYDCDGVCATTILYKALHAKGAHVFFYMPDRFSDGYGFSMQSIDKIKAKGATLIISVDNGITAVQEVRYAKELGIDIIITDHHNCSDVLPDAYVIINPKRKGEKYPYENLCGAAVAYKVALALGVDDENLVNEMLVFAAVATVADLVPLTLENRSMVSLGLALIKKRGNLGLTKLIEVSGLCADTVTSGQVSYHIAPRINACGRLYKADTAVELFLEQDEVRALRLANDLNAYNVERREIEAEIMNEAEQYIFDNKLAENDDVFIIKLDNANEGVIGVACGKICEKYNRPTIICVQKDGICKGSARSIPKLNIYELLNKAKDLYLKFGGHSQAAGFTIKAENFDEMCAVIHTAACESNIKRALIKSSYYDIEAVSSTITEKAVRELALFSPYGIQNPCPIFRLSSVSLRNFKALGKNKEHLKFNVLHKFCNFSAIGFSMAETYMGILNEQELYDILFSVEINTYKSSSSIQLNVKEIVPHHACPKQYYESLYDHFMRTDIYTGQAEHRFDMSDIESALSVYADTLYILHGKDAYFRLYNFAAFISVDTHVCYGRFDAFHASKINCLVNPLDDSYLDAAKYIAVLDPPCFSDYAAEIYPDEEKIRLLKTDRYIADIIVNRDYVAFVYKRLRAADSFGGDIDKFISYLNTESEKEINYFTFMLCLDIMYEMGVIKDYEILDGKLCLTFNKIVGQKDIGLTPTFLKLNRTSMCTEV